MHEKIDSILSYLVAGWCYMCHLDWMGVGATVLLLARLVVDLPKAYLYIRKVLKNGKVNN